MNDPQPARDPKPEPHLIAAALVQHDVSRHVNEQMTRLEMTADDLAGDLGVSTEQAKRLLRGESGLSLERIYQLARIVGLTVAVTVQANQ